MNQSKTFSILFEFVGDFISRRLIDDHWLRTNIPFLLPKFENKSNIDVLRRNSAGSDRIFIDRNDYRILWIFSLVRVRCRKSMFNRPSEHFLSEVSFRLRSISFGEFPFWDRFCFYLAFDKFVFVCPAMFQYDLCSFSSRIVCAKDAQWFRTDRSNFFS